MKKQKIEVNRTIKWTKKPNRKYFLQHLIENNNYTTMAEVGVRDGRTTFHLLDKITTLTIYAIDSDIDLFYNDAVKQKYKDRLVPIEGDSSKVAGQIPSVDLVFIDADHTYRGVCKDINAYASKVNTGGVFSGHDIDYPGVNRAVNELVVDYEVGPNNVWFKFIS